MRRVSLPQIGGWWWVIGGVAGVCLLGVAGCLWFFNDSDWRRAQAVARARGTATTWEEAGFVAMSAEERAQIDQVLAIGKRYSSLPSMAQGPRQVEAPTTALIEHHRTIPDAFWPELLAAIQALPTEPHSLYERYTVSTSMDLISEQRALVRLLSERIRLCPIAELPTTIEAGLRLAQLAKDQSLIQHLVSISCVAILAPAVGSRRADIQTSAAVDRISGALDRCADDLWQSRLSTWRGETTFLFTNYLHLDWDASTRGGGPPRDWLGKPLETGKELLRPLVWRLNRERGLRSAIELEYLVRMAHDDHDLIAKGRAFPLPEAILPEFASWVGVDPFPLIPAHGLVNGGLAKARLQLAVLSADLRQQPVPLDPFASPPAPLKPIERDGRTIGWYSVGPNGGDEGGIFNQDFGIPLTESLGRHRFSDAPEPRKP